jgi:putative colanic acid biosynthesis UDP-glucose lipid carrier transferase
MPKLINVLRGEMSIIGPAPHVPDLAARLSQLIPTYGERAKIRPGITGWAQVHKCTTWDEAVEHDLYYVNNRSLKLDLIIMWRTMARVWSATD